jgi:lysophospholipase L1-like esterase
MDAIDEAAPRGPYDLVSLLIGVNDQYRARPVDQFAADFSPLLDRAVNFAGGRQARVIAISIPDWGATPFADGRDRARIGREIDDYNARARLLAERRGVLWHDVTQLSRAVLENPELVIADQLHPSGAMYAQWAESMEPVVLAALSAADRTAARS